jgi:hypothetical protein
MTNFNSRAGPFRNCAGQFILTHIKQKQLIGCAAAVTATVKIEEAASLAGSATLPFSAITLPRSSIQVIVMALQIKTLKMLCEKYENLICVV